MISSHVMAVLSPFQMNHHCSTLLQSPTGIRSCSERFPVARFLSNVVNKKTGASSAASSQLMCACSGWLACNEEKERHSFSIRPEKRESAGGPPAQSRHKLCLLSPCILTQRYWHHNNMSWSPACCPKLSRWSQYKSSPTTACDNSLSNRRIVQTFPESDLPVEVQHTVVPIHWCSQPLKPHLTLGSDTNGCWLSPFALCYPIHFLWPPC